MARLVTICMFVIVPLRILAADEPSDEKAIQGTWLPAKAELSGQPWTEDALKTIVMKLNDGKYEVSVAGQLDRGTFILDSKLTPKGMTITGREGPNKGK